MTNFSGNKSTKKREREVTQFNFNGDESLDEERPQRSAPNKTQTFWKNLTKIVLPTIHENIRLVYFHVSMHLAQTALDNLMNYNRFDANDRNKTRTNVERCNIYVLIGLL